MINRDFTSGVQFHDCEEKEKLKNKSEIINVYQKEDKKWYMCVAYNSDYCGDERESEIKICPYCGERL